MFVLAMSLDRPDDLGLQGRLPADQLAVVPGFPSLSWLAASPEAAPKGIRQVVSDVLADLKTSGEAVPVPLAEKHYSGEFRVRIPPELHRALAMQAAEQRVSLNRLASAKLAG